MDHFYYADGKDSQGGLNSNNKDTFDVYTKAKSTLEAMGYSVVRTLDEYM